MYRPQPNRTPTQCTDSDRVVLLDESGRPRGSAPRSGVHHEQTPLHRAFSCYLVNDRGEMLLTRRALTKVAWPGVWTNSFCGHPRPEEAWVDAVRRYGKHELGTEVTEAQMLLPDFRYRAIDPGGVVENEICPVFGARGTAALDPNPDEVAEHRWVPIVDLGRLVGLAPWLLSPWFVQQVRALSEGSVTAPLDEGGPAADIVRSLR